MSSQSYQIIYRELMAELEDAIRYTESCIRSAHSGMTGWILDRILGMMYQWFGISRAREVGARRLRFLLDIASQYNGSNLDELRSRYLEQYISSHPLLRRVNQSHPEYPKLIQILKRDFELRVEFLSRLLRSSGSDFPQIFRNAFTESQAREIVQAQIKSAREILELINSHPRILRIPALIRRSVLRVVNQVERYESSRLEQKWREIYGHESQ